VLQLSQLLGLSCRSWRLPERPSWVRYRSGFVNCSSRGPVCPAWRARQLRLTGGRQPTEVTCSARALTHMSLYGFILISSTISSFHHACEGA
jgi:hypothetical protein